MSVSVEEFYDRLWARHRPEYGASREHLEGFFENGEVRGKSVLDAGCGSGVFSVIFAEKGAVVTGVDASEKAIEAGKELKRERGEENVEFMRADMLDLPFRDSSFDVVWAWGSVHHTERPMHALDELLRVLNTNGVMLLALYRKSRLTPLHGILTRIFSRAPLAVQPFLAKLMALMLYPFVALFRKREKVRKGETLEHLVLDWFFVPARRHFDPDEIRSYVEARGLEVERVVDAAGRFDSTSNFILKMRRAE
jgi:2-polyprenyl-6-hydroxyphenyl methylase/3-demethylubiquinone-9 3-methyltransferase